MFDQIHSKTKKKNKKNMSNEMSLPLHCPGVTMTSSMAVNPPPEASPSISS